MDRQHSADFAGPYFQPKEFTMRATSQFCAIDAEIAGLPGPDYIKETWWSIAIAAEPIARETLHQMSIGKPGEIDRAIVELIERGLIERDGGPDIYRVSRRFYPGLRVFGGIYDREDRAWPPEE